MIVPRAAVLGILLALGAAPARAQSSGDALCGTVAWASEQAKRDSAKTTSQLVGTQILTGLKPDKRGRWQGKLFIPDRNMRVTAKIERSGSDQLKVSGCAVGKSLCKSALWTRVDGPLPASD